MSGRATRAVDWATAHEQLARAARSLADRDTGAVRIRAAYRERAAALAVPAAPSAAGEENLQVVVFRLAGDNYAAPLRRIERIIPDPVCTALPGVEGRWAGVMIADGEILPVLHLARVLGLAEPEQPPERQVLKLCHGGTDFGVLVGAVLEIRGIPRAALSPLTGNARLVHAVAPGNLLVLDIEALIAEELLT